MCYQHLTGSDSEYRLRMGVCVWMCVWVCVNVMLNASNNKKGTHMDSDLCIKNPTIITGSVTIHDHMTYKKLKILRIKLNFNLTILYVPSKLTLRTSVAV